jgi:hypothetical protein
MNHTRFQALDPYQYNFTKPFDEAIFSRNLIAGLTPGKKESFAPSKELGYQDVTTQYGYNPDDKNVLRNRGEVAYQTIPGVTNMTNKVIKNGQVGNFQNQFNELYPGQNINNAKPFQIAAAIGLSLTPHGKTDISRVADNSFAFYKKKADYSSSLTRGNAAYAKSLTDQEMSSPQTIVDNIFDEGVKSNFTYQIKKGGGYISGKEISLPNELQEKYFDKISGNLYAPDKVIMDNDKKNIHLIYFKGVDPKTKVPRVDQEQSRTYSVNNTVIPDIGKAYGGATYSRKYLFGQKVAPNPGNWVDRHKKQ